MNCCNTDHFPKVPAEIFFLSTYSCHRSEAPQASRPQPKDFGEPWFTNQRTGTAEESRRAVVAGTEVQFSVETGLC